MRESVPTVLVMSGLDPTGGAGLAADLRALATLDVHVRAIVTANTQQGPRSAVRILPTQGAFLEEQIRGALQNGADSIKTGLVPDEVTARVIARSLPPDALLVSDPVLRTSGGDSLVAGSAASVYAPLIARSHVVTPNAAEARAMTGLSRVEDAAWALRKMGAKNVLVTGGDEPGPTVTDLLLTSEGDLVRHEAPRIDGGPTRGTGCTLASLVAGHLAQGYAVKQAVLAGIGETRERIRHAAADGGQNVLRADPRSLLPDARAFDAETRGRIAEVAGAWRSLRPQLPRSVVPEVGANLAYLPPDGDPLRAAVLSARCVRTGTGTVLAGPVEVGGAHHTARIAGIAYALDERVRCAMNLRHRSALSEAARDAGFVVASFRREDQPATEPSTVAWGTRAAFAAACRTPDVITDEGGPGKEPMLRILGESPADVVGKVEQLLADGC